MDPKSLVVVVGDPDTYRGVGPILNLTCEFSNDWDRSVVIRRLGLEGEGPLAREYHLRWHLFYDTEGRQQTKIDASAPIEDDPSITDRAVGIPFPAHDADWSRGAKQALPASAGDAAATVKAVASVPTVTELTFRRSPPSA